VGREGMLYLELLPQAKTVKAHTYSDQLQKLTEAIREKRPRRTSVHLLHDNARAHVAKETQQKLAILGWDAVPHPPYSPDIAPSDYHLFRHLKQHLAGKSFAKYGNLELDITNFFESQPLEFWARGIGDLPNRWANVVNNCGGYIID
jgi:[histone H3]-lysine36 N-dimethyltransferase SETMAR